MTSRATFPRRRRWSVSRTGRPDDADAFLPDPSRGGRARTDDALAECLAEEFLSSATSAEEVNEEVRDAVLPEEFGGPFIEVRAATEYCRESDETDGDAGTKAAREPFPRAMRAPYR
jgi:hypothetical protein